MQVRSHRLRRTAMTVAALLAMTMVLASPSLVGQAATASSASHLQADVDPGICSPYPPDYPGCTAQQVRPYKLGEFRGDYTGHAAGYRGYRMGQHPRGVPWRGIIVNYPALDQHLRSIYYDAVQRWHRSAIAKGKTAAAAWPAFRTWPKFKAASIGICPDWGSIGGYYPTRYCDGIVQGIGGKIRETLWKTEEIVLDCSGVTIGGLAADGWKIWRTGTGFLKRGFVTGEALFIGCQTQSLWETMSGWW